MNGPARFTNQLAEHQADRRDASATPTAEELLARNILEVALDQLTLRGRSIHDAVAIVDDGQNPMQVGHEARSSRVPAKRTRVILTGRPRPDRPRRGGRVVEQRRPGGRALQRASSTFAHLTMKEVVRSRIAGTLASRLLWSGAARRRRAAAPERPAGAAGRPNARQTGANSAGTRGQPCFDLLAGMA